MRLFAISFFTLLFVGIILLSARIWGLGQVYAPYDHVLLSSTPVWAVEIQTTDAALGVAAAQPTAWLILPVRISKDKKFFILPEAQDQRFHQNRLDLQKKDPSTMHLKGNRLSDYDYEELLAYYGQLPLLEDFYRLLPQSIFALNLIDNVTEFHAYLNKLLSDFESDKRTFVFSDTHVLISATKELRPAWVYGSSVSDLTRLLSFDSIGILPATPFKFDVLTAPLSYRQRPALNAALVTEIQRRKKKVFATLLTAPDCALAKGLGVDGYFMRSIEDLNRCLAEDQAL